MQAQKKTDVSARVYRFAATATQLLAWFLMVASMWRFILGEFRHPISLLGILIDKLGMQRSGYWMDAPPNWDHGYFVLFQWPTYYVTGLALYAIAGYVLLGVLIGLDRLMMSSHQND